MLPDTCGDTDVSSNTWLLLVTIFLAFASFVIELQYILETLKIINKLKTLFQKGSSEDGAEPQ